MNWLDIVIIIALVVPTFSGYMRGLVKSALSLAGLIAGVVLASNFYRELAGALTFIDNPDIANIAAFIIILVAVLVIAHVLASLLRATIKAISLGWVDHAGGAVFGFLLGAIFISAILATIVKFFGEGLVTESAVAAIMLDRFPAILGLLPGEFDAIREFFQGQGPAPD